MLSDEQITDFDSRAEQLAKDARAMLASYDDLVERINNQNNVIASQNIAIRDRDAQLEKQDAEIRKLLGKVARYETMVGLIHKVQDQISDERNGGDRPLAVVQRPQLPAEQVN